MADTLMKGLFCRYTPTGLFGLRLALYCMCLVVSVPSAQPGGQQREAVVTQALNQRGSVVVLALHTINVEKPSLSQ